ncbi:MAG: CDP-glucose 4,6-dehydratase [Clostridia bacterium]|jgi:CDP-glucose 4,6-dehydratase|nr:CDP-glucose 4,6-dehydratase [Clostridia bacterium]
MEGMGRLMFKLDLYRGKRVLITGHTGFKGSWMCKVLAMLGAEVAGYSLEAPTAPNLFEVANVGSYISSTIGDIRNLEQLKKCMNAFKPEIVIHMAAQSIVRESYHIPVYTYETNVMGTVNILEAVRSCSSVKSFVNVTTDKVYQNNEWEWGYREDDHLDGYDPYSNSKSCSELVTSCYRKSFFSHADAVAISTCRAGNVIGGGDFSKDRIIPDCVRAVENGQKIVIRNPHSIRPYQHVLEPVCAYLMVALEQYNNKSVAGCYNVGPDDIDCVTTGNLTDLFCNAWGDGASWENIAEVHAPHEANFLKLDSSRIKNVFGWQPQWHIHDAIGKTVEWSKIYLSGGNVDHCMENQIKEYLEDIK